jgi:hypothetical protein
MCSAGNKARSTNQMARFSSSEPLGAEKEKNNRRDCQPKILLTLRQKELGNVL